MPIRLDTDPCTPRKSLRIFDAVVRRVPESGGTSHALAIAWGEHGPGAGSSGGLGGMKVTCAWCQREGQPASLGERDPLDDPAETHGICRRHTLDLLDCLPSRSFPGVRLLLVVSPQETALYEHLQRELADVRGVMVMLERRRCDGRLDGQTPSEERRLRQGEVSDLGYTVIRFGR